MFTEMIDMNMNKGRGKKNLIIKTWERCTSVGRSNSTGKKFHESLYKSKSWSSRSPDSPTNHEEKRKKKHRVVPEGCFTVYVGPEKQRFVIKTECVNHPLFKILLEEAELEYGFHSEGPLVLPCQVDLFYKVLSEMDTDEIPTAGCNFTKGYGSYRLLSPSRMVARDGF